MTNITLIVRKINRLAKGRTAGELVALALSKGVAIA